MFVTVAARYTQPQQICATEVVCTYLVGDDAIPLQVGRCLACRLWDCWLLLHLKLVAPMVKA